MMSKHPCPAQRGRATRAIAALSHHRRQGRSVTIAAAVGLSLAGCSGEAAPGDAESFPEAAYAAVTSDSGAVTFEVRTAPTQPPGRGRVTVEFAITEGPAEGLSLDVVPWMPEMGHGASTVPVVEALPGGLYRASSVDFFMPGRWELRTAISGAVTDHAVVPFQIP